MRILLATDGSRYALSAARTLADWLDRPGISVDLLAVIPRASRSLHRGHGAAKEVAAGWRGAAGNWLAETAAPLEARGFRVARSTLLGNPASVVTRRAAEGYDLVVVGAKGRGDAPFFDIGSVALAVLEHAPAPVLMVRERDAKHRYRRVRSRTHRPRVLLALDDSPASGRALARLRSLVDLREADVGVLSVADEPVGGALGLPDAWALARESVHALERAGYRAEPQVRSGRPAPLIVSEAQQEEADLLVLGSRGVGRIEERHMGSVALEVARSAPCTLLLIREGAPAAAVAEVEEEVRPVTPFEIAYRNVEPSLAVEKHVLAGLAGLERISSRIVRCRVTVDLANSRHRTGNLYHVRVDLTVPDHEVVVSRTPAAHHQDESVITAIGEAFDTARRRLLEVERRHRGEVKSHEAVPHGRVSELMPDHGFIETPEGRTVYFHRNAVLDDAFDELELGSELRFSEEMGEEGPQATTVQPIGKHHLVG